MTTELQSTERYEICWSDDGGDPQVIEKTNSLHRATLSVESADLNTGDSIWIWDTETETVIKERES